MSSKLGPAAAEQLKLVAQSVRNDAQEEGIDLHRGRRAKSYGKYLRFMQYDFALGALSKAIEGDATFQVRSRLGLPSSVGEPVFKPANEILEPYDIALERHRRWQNNGFTLGSYIFGGNSIREKALDEITVHLPAHLTE